MRARTEMPAGGGEHEDATLRLVIETLKRGGEGTQQIYIKQVVGRPLDLHGRHKTLIKYEVPGVASRLPWTSTPWHASSCSQGTHARL